MPQITQQATVDPCLCWRLLDTHREVWLSLLWGHCSFLLDPGMHKVLFVPSKSLFPWSCESSVIKFYSPSKSNSLGILSPFAGSPDWESVVDPSTFATVWELLWYNCSAVCGESAWQVYGGANGDLVQEDLCHIPCLPGLLQPEPVPHGRPQLTRASTGDTQIFKSLTQSLVGSLGPGVHKVLFESSEHLWWVWGLILNAILPLLPSC